MGHKIKIVSGGGLGDALMIYAKIIRKKFEDYKLTHVEVPETLLNAISQFYGSQKIDYEVLKINSWSWMIENEKNYDIRLDTSAYGIERDGIEIEPFIDIKTEDLGYDFDITLSPSSGRDNERRFSKEECDYFLDKNGDKKIALVGSEGYGFKQRDNVSNLIGKTSIPELLSILKSSQAVVANQGFITYASCTMGKKVFCKEPRIDIRERYNHKSWDNNMINNLYEL